MEYKRYKKHANSNWGGVKYKIVIVGDTYYGVVEFDDWIDLGTPPAYTAIGVVEFDDWIDLGTPPAYTAIGVVEFDDWIDLGTPPAYTAIGVVEFDDASWD